MTVYFEFYMQYCTYNSNWYTSCSIHTPRGCDVNVPSFFFSTVQAAAASHILVYIRIYALVLPRDVFLYKKVLSVAEIDRGHQSTIPEGA